MRGEPADANNRAPCRQINFVSVVGRSAAWRPSKSVRRRPFGPTDHPEAIGHGASRRRGGGQRGVDPSYVSRDDAGGQNHPSNRPSVCLSVCP